MDNFQLETALQQLNEIVSQLESGEGTLDEAMHLFEQGQALVKRCQLDLEAKDLRIQQILEDETLTPFTR